MATTLANGVAWGSAPTNSLTFQYDKSREGADQKYKFYVSIAPCSGASYYGYPIYMDILLDGAEALSGVTLKASSPSQWSSAITYTSAWLTVPNKTTGTTALKIRIYSGSGSSRDTTYSYSLPIDAAASPVSASDAYIESSCAIIINKANSAFVHTLAYSIDGGSTYTQIVSRTGAESYGWWVPAELYEKIPNSRYLSINIRCQTYSGWTLVGTTYCDIHAYIQESRCRPTIEVSAEDIRVPTLHLTGNSKRIITAHSTLRVTAAATVKNHATPKRMAVDVVNVQYVENDVLTMKKDFPAVAAAMAHASITDSRDLYVTNDTEGLVDVGYFSPTRTVKADRVEQTSDVVNLSVEGSWFNGSFGAVQNTLRVWAHYRLKGGEYGDFVALTVTPNGNRYTATGQFSGLDYTKAYEIQVRVCDKIYGDYETGYEGYDAATCVLERPIDLTVMVKPGIPVFDYGETSFNFNVPIYFDNQPAISWSSDYRVIIHGAGLVTDKLSVSGSVLTSGALFVHGIYAVSSNDANDRLQFGTSSAASTLYGSKVEINSASDGVYINGALYTSSSEKIKEDIREEGSVLDIIRNSKIYRYKYKADKNKKESLGFVIERETPADVISADGEHVNLYTMTAIAWSAVQEILKRLEKLEKKGGSGNGKKNTE